MSNINPMCCGEKCGPDGSQEVRIYPLGAGGNLYLCRTCFWHENNYRREKGAYYGRPDDWPIIQWDSAVKVTEG